MKKMMIVTAVLTAAASLVCAQGRQREESANNQRIVGTWQVSRHGVDCDSGNQIGPDFPALMTFAQGGTLTAYAIPPNGTTPATTSPEYGTWSKLPGSHTYLARDISYSYDENGAFTGGGVVTATITLNAGGNTFTYTATVDFFDADGNPLFSVCGMATGTRF